MRKKPVENRRPSVEIERVDCDVLVIGAGAAGLRAAIAAKGLGYRVLVVSKRPPGQAGATPSAVLTYCAAVGEGDCSEFHEEDTWRWGYYLGNHDLISTFANEAPESVKWLQDYGMRWDMENGQYSLVKLAGHRIARGLYFDHMTGRELVRILNKVALDMGITIRPYIWVMDLLRRGNRVAGALAYDWEKGGMVSFRSGAVVLASGGSQQLFSLNTAPRDLCGDGFSMAYRCGAKLVDMEFVQMYPTVIIRPSAARGVPLTSGVLLREGSELVNGNGELFLSKYTGSAIGDATRDVLSMAIAKEITAGRGSPHQGVYFKLGQAPRSFLEERHFKYLKKLGVDLSAGEVEVAPGAHFWLGGVAIDSNGASSIPGLFAAGEVAGGLHGANRLAGNALPETLVFGKRAGTQAALFVAECGVPDNPAKESECLEFLFKTRTGHRKPQYFLAGLQELIQEGCGVLRRDSLMRQTLRELNVIGQEAMMDLKVNAFPIKYDNEYVLAIELFHLLETGRLLLTSAIQRQESRGAHQRTDFPDMDMRGPVSQYLEQGIGGLIRTSERRTAPGADLIIHLLSGDDVRTFQFYGVKGKTVMEILQTIPEFAGEFLHYTDHNCKRGLCGHCKMRINNQSELACLRIINEEELTIERV
jgi:succinate dehydrogenase/fumarate reductase flavoprotein subunit